MGVARSMTEPVVRRAVGVLHCLSDPTVQGVRAAPTNERDPGEKVRQPGIKGTQACYYVVVPTL